MAVTIIYIYDYKDYFKNYKTIFATQEKSDLYEGLQTFDHFSKEVLKHSDTGRYLNFKMNDDIIRFYYETNLDIQNGIITMDVFGKHSQDNYKVSKKIAKTKIKEFYSQYQAI